METQEISSRKIRIGKIRIEGLLQSHLINFTTLNEISRKSLKAVNDASQLRIELDECDDLSNLSSILEKLKTISTGQAFILVPRGPRREQLGLISKVAALRTELALNLQLETPARRPRDLEVHRYEVLEPLGSGGMGSVYRARHRALDLELALKIHRRGPLASASQIQALQNEARALARLNHPNIIRIFDCGQDGDLYYLAMEIIPKARSLSMTLNTEPMAPAKLLQIIELIARAIQHCHNRDIIHGDVKSSNILLDPDFRPRLIDFGLSTDLQGPNPKQRRSGTRPYMAPELLHSEGTRPKPGIDIWALGIMLFRCWSGRYPFLIPERNDSFTPSQAFGEPPWELPDKQVPAPQFKAWPKSLQDLCRQAMTVDPQERLQSAELFADRLNIIRREIFNEANEMNK